MCRFPNLATHPVGSPTARFSAPALHYCDVGIIQKINLFDTRHSKTTLKSRHQAVEDRGSRRLIDILRHHRQVAEVDGVRCGIENQTRARRSEERRVGKGWVSTCRSRV